MQKQLGIIRSKTERLQAIKREAARKKNRFQMVGKENDEYEGNAFSLTTTNSEPRSHSEFGASLGESSNHEAVELFESARLKLNSTREIQKKMGELTKSRLTCLREKENEKYDEKISKLASQATSSLLRAESFLKQIKALETQSPLQKKINRSIECSLASEIQEASRSLRQQEQEYFKRVRAYEGSTVNSAIRLTEEQRRAMEGEWEELEEKQEEKGKVGELVGSITRLSALYKELNQMVVAQGTVIDRIDYNLEATHEHTKKAVVHLKGADEAASSEFAGKIIKMLVVSIIVMAVLLGIKYMA